MPRTFHYDVTLRRDGDRLATISSGARAPLEVAPPGDFPGGDDTRWSPEHLFLASLATCTMLSFNAHASAHEIEITGYECAIDGTIMRRAEDGRYAFVELRQQVTVTVPSGQRDEARALVGRAERDCFISASTNAELQVDWDVREG